MKIKRWHVWLGVLISVVFLWLAFRKVDFSLVWQYLGQANWAWVLLGLVFYFFGVALRVEIVRAGGLRWSQAWNIRTGRS